MYDNNTIRSHFPYLNQEIIYLDSAATSLKPLSVIDAESNYYKHLSQNTGRGSGLKNFQATEQIEGIRHRTAKFIGAKSPKEIIYTSNTTEAINMVARCYIKEQLTPHSNIVITMLEHHSNYVPWMELAREMGIECRVIPLDGYSINMKDFRKYIDENTIITAITGMSNLTGAKTDIKEISDLCHGLKSKLLVDAAQLICHKHVDVEMLNIDFLAFSAHKLYGPFGLGVLYGKANLLKEFSPYRYGGNMVSYITDGDNIHYKDLPARLESGTQNAAAIYAFGSVLDFLEDYPIEENEEVVEKLSLYLTKELEKLGGITIYSKPGSIVSFNIDGVHPHDASDFFDKQGVVVRTGALCASPFFTHLDCAGVIRISFGIFNNNREIDILIETIKEIKEFFL